MFVEFLKYLTEKNPNPCNYIIKNDKLYFFFEITNNPMGLPVISQVLIEGQI